MNPSALTAGHPVPPSSNAGPSAMKTSLRRILVLLLPAACLTAFGQVAWHFDFDNGRPVKLVWQTQPGQMCDLRQAMDLPAWSQVPGFPKAATGTAMEHPLLPGDQGYFQISVASAAAGWQRAVLPELPADSTSDTESA
jgi:hypothetical protein